VGSSARPGAIVAPAATSDLKFPAAPKFSADIMYVPNRSSVRVFVPPMANARDYRVYAVSGVITSENSDKAEIISGATIVCAGLWQRNACDESERSTIRYNSQDGFFDLASCKSNRVTKTVLNQIELDGLTGPTTIVVEALDGLCPFPGALGTKGETYSVADSDPKQPSGRVTTDFGSLQRWPESHRIYTESELRAAYDGNLIINGQGWAAGPAVNPADPTKPLDPKNAEGAYVRLGKPAANTPRKVLARAIVSVSPLGTSTRPTGFKDTDFFADFSDAKPPAFYPHSQDIVAPSMKDYYDPLRVETDEVHVFDVDSDLSDISLAHGTLRFLSAAQEGFTNQTMYPKRPFMLPGDEARDTYLHVTFETQTGESARRYWYLSLCGGAVGTTYEGNRPKVAFIPSPGFMDDDPARPAHPLGWNCLHFVPRGGSYFSYPAGVGGETIRSETTLKLLATKQIAINSLDDWRSGVDGKVVVTSLNPESDEGKLWTRRMTNGKPSGVLLDDEQFVHQRTKLDFYIRNNQAVMFANGEQRACAVFSKAPLTMNEATVAVGKVFYHSTAEFGEFRGKDWYAQYQYRHNMPFFDERSFDNFGVRSAVKLPTEFDPKSCVTF